MKNIEFVDFGTDSDKSVDYPDYAFKLCTGIINKKVDSKINAVYFFLVLILDNFQI